MVFTGSTASLARRLRLALRSSADLSNPLGPLWFEEAARNLYPLASHPVIGLIVRASAFFLAYAGKGRLALLVLVTVAFGILGITFYLVIPAVFLAVAVGISRVYLDLHYPTEVLDPTDVLAGWCVESAWAMLCWGTALYLDQQGKLRSTGSVV